MIFQSETLYEIIDEMDELLSLHYDELTLNKAKVKLDPMWENYARLENLGFFKVFTARDDEKLVGYNAFFLNKHLHYASLTVAQNDVLFLHPAYRQGLTGVKLLRFSEAQLKEMGAEKILYHVKFSKDIRPILHRMGYSDEEVMVAKFV